MKTSVHEGKLLINPGREPTVLFLLRERLPGARWRGDLNGFLIEPSPLQINRLMDIEHAVLEQRLAEVTATPEALHICTETLLRYQAVRDTTPDVGQGEPMPDGLFPFQRKMIEAVKEKRKALVTATMGLGKSVVGIKSVEETQTLPCAVVVPASIKVKWAREIEKWTGKKAFVLKSKPSPSMEKKLAKAGDVQYYVVNYEILTAWIPLFREKGVKSAIVDEAHYIKNHTAQRSRAVAELLQGLDVRILLTGTPIINRPAELVHPLEVLDSIDLFGGRRGFYERYQPIIERTVKKWVGGKLKDVTFQDYAPAQNLPELSSMLKYGPMVRVRREDVLTQLPPIQRQVVPVELPNMREYLTAEQDFVEYVRAEVIEKGLDEAEARKKVTAAMRGGAFVKIGALKRVAARGKIGATVDVVENAVEEGEQVIVFVIHKEIGNAIRENLTDRKVVTVAFDGDTNPTWRQKMVDVFQKGDAKVLVCTVGAGGVGLDITKARTVVFAETPWTPMEVDQAESRAFGRMSDLHGGNSIFIIGSRTIDERVWNKVLSKRLVSGSAIDGVADNYEYEVIQDLLNEA